MPPGATWWRIIDSLLAAGGAGFKPLADWVHAGPQVWPSYYSRDSREAVEKNLPIAGSGFHAADAANTADTCGWKSDNYGLKANAAAQAYYDSIVRLYAGWESTSSRSTAFPDRTRRMRST